VHATGSCKNETVGEVMHWHCKKSVRHLQKLTVTPASLKCEITGGEIKTNEMTAVTRETETGKGPGVNFVPEGGLPFAKFTLGGAGCKLGAPTVEVKGNAVGKISGATLTFDEGSTKGTASGEGLFIGKSAASVTAIGTGRMVGGNPIGVTKK
jgi:hypothetical protein